jgi:hypothetical protein
MSWLNIVPNWAWAALLAAALALAGVKCSEADGLQVAAARAERDLEKERGDRQAENTRRAMAALAELQRVAGLAAEHAKNQKEIVDGYENTLQGLESERNAATSDARRVRGEFAAYAARDREAARTDPAACQRVADRSEVVADLAGEGRELLSEGRLLVKGRDAEVAALLNIVKNDRHLQQAVHMSAPSGEGAAQP